MVKFFLFFALNFELLLISETLGILCAGLHRNELVGMIILATFYVPLLMFTGFIQVSACSAALPNEGPCAPAHDTDSTSASTSTRHAVSSILRPLAHVCWAH